MTITPAAGSSSPCNHVPAHDNGVGIIFYSWRHHVRACGMQVAEGEAELEGEEEERQASLMMRGFLIVHVALLGSIAMVTR